MVFHTFGGLSLPETKGIYKMMEYLECSFLSWRPLQRDVAHLIISLLFQTRLEYCAREISVPSDSLFEKNGDIHSLLYVKL